MCKQRRVGHEDVRIAERRITELPFVLPFFLPFTMLETCVCIMYIYIYIYICVNVNVYVYVYVYIICTCIYKYIPNVYGYLYIGRVEEKKMKEGGKEGARHLESTCQEYSGCPA